MPREGGAGTFGTIHTYWQCEYAMHPDSLGTKDLRQMEGGGDDVTPDQLRAAALSLGNTDLIVAVTLTLPKPTKINWLSLLPMNFGETAWLRICDVKVAESLDGKLKTAPGFDSSVFGNLLTDDVNSEIPSEVQQQTLSTGPYSHRGSGIKEIGAWQMTHAPSWELVWIYRRGAIGPRRGRRVPLLRTSGRVMERLFVDTSARLAFVNRMDRRHKRVSDVLRQYEGRLVTTNFVFEETITLTGARLSHPVAVHAGRLPREPDVAITVRVIAGDEEAAFELFVARPDKRYSFTDCTSWFALH